MADPREVLDLSRPDGSADPLGQPMEFRTREERDAETFQAGASEFSKGARSGFNQMSAGVDELMGLAGGTLGLTDWAARKFAEAEATTKFADSVAPRVRDVFAIRDFNDFADWAAGALGQAAASSVPAVIGGVGGAAAAGLRGAMVGLGAGSFVPNAGEQAVNLRGAPGTYGQKLANSLAVGTGNAALDVLPGAMVARQVLRPAAMGARQLAKQGLKVTGAEALTEGAQDVVGQVGEMALDPSKELDPRSVANSMAAGAVGGAGLAGAGHVVSAAPGAAAGGVEKLRELTKRERIEEATGHVPDVVDSNDLDRVISDPKVGGDPEAISKALDDLDADEESSLTKVARAMGENAAKFEGWATDPDKREEFKAAAKQWVNDHKYAPRVKEAFDRAKSQFEESAEAAKKAYGDEKAKHALGRTVLDAQVLETVNRRLPDRIKANTTAEQRAEIASWFKHAAMYAGARQEVEGPGRPTSGDYTSAPGIPEADAKGNLAPRRDEKVSSNREQDRATTSVPLPSALLHFGGKDTHAIIEEVQAVLKANLGEGQVRGRPKAAVAEAARRASSRRSPLERAIHENLKQDIYESPDDRRAATEGFMRLLAADAAPNEVRDIVASGEKENQRLSPSGQRIMEAAGLMFQDRPKAMRQIEAVVQNRDFAREFHMTEQEIKEFEGLNEEVDEDQDAVDGFEERRDAEQSYENDPRLRTYEGTPEGLEEARQNFRSLQGTYDKRHVRISHVPEMTYDADYNEVPTGRITLVATDVKSDDVSMSGKPAVRQKDGTWKGSGQWGDITDKDPSNQAGFKHGTLTVKRKDGKVVRVSIKALTKMAMKMTDRPGDSATYVEDMVKRGLSMLLSDPAVESVHEKMTLPALGDEQWDLPDSTVVAAWKGKDVTWGEVKEGIDPTALRDERVADRLVESAQRADDVSAAEEALNTARGQYKALAKEVEVGRKRLANARAKMKVFMPAMHKAVQDAQNAVEEADAEAEAAVKAARAAGEAFKADKTPKTQAAWRAARAARDEAVLAYNQAVDALERAKGAVKGAQAQNRRAYALTGEEYAAVKEDRDQARRQKNDALKRARVFERATDRIEEEIDRRRRDGDKPFMSMGDNNADQHMIDQKQPTKERNVDELTGATVRGAERRDTRPGFLPHEVGQKPEDRAPGPVTVTKPGEEQRDVMGYTAAERKAVDDSYTGPHEPQPSDEEVAREEARQKKNEQGAGDVLTLEQEGLYRAAKEFVGEDIARKLIAGLRADEARTGMTERQANEAKGRKATMKRLLEKGGNSEWKQEQLRNLASLYATKKSDLRANALEPITDEQIAEIKEYIERVLGKGAKKFIADMAHAGEFFLDKKGIETIRIAALAMDPIGAARHEAAHALFARLLKSDKAAAQALLAAASSPDVMLRLRGLLKGHPEALKQLSDPEERLAYMYQFWNAKEFSAGRGTEKWFDKVKDFFRKLASVWTGTFYESENAGAAAQIFDLFDRGALRDRDTVAEVLKDKMVRSAIARAGEVMGPAAKAAKALIYTSVSGVRSMNVPAFNEVMEKMWHDPTKAMAKPGFNQAKHPVRNQYLSRLDAALGGMSAEAQRQALEALQAGVEPATTDARTIVAGIRPVLDDLFRYMQGKGVKAVVWNDRTGEYEEHDVQFVEKYFPRYYDKDTITARRKEFVAMLQRNGLTLDESNKLADKIGKRQAASPTENDEEVGLTYFAPNTQARKLKIPAAELAPFLRKDLGDTMRSYIAYAVRRAEYADRFGNQGQLIKEAEKRAVEHEGATPEQVKAFNRAVQALEGSLGYNLDPRMKSAMSAVQTYQHLRLLPLAIFSSLTVDPLGIVVRGGTAGEAFGSFVRVVRGMVHEQKDEAFDMAVTVGSISSAIDTYMLQEAYGTDEFNSAVSKVNSALFRWNGMEGLNRAMRVAATAAGHNFIVRHATKPTEHSERYLSELGLTKEDVKVVDGKLDLADQKIRDAINMWVDGAVLRPNAAIRPTWTSDPHWMLVSSLKQYMYAYQETIIKRVVHEMSAGNYTPAYALLSYIPAIIAADVLRAMLTPGGGDDRAWERMDLGDVMARGVRRAGITGPMGQYAMDSMGDMRHYNVPFASLGGPTFEQLANMGKAAAGAPGADLGNELVRSIPGYILVK